MVIFHSYVKLPEGNQGIFPPTSFHFCFFSNVFGQDQNMKTSILKYVFKDQDYWPWQTDFKVIIFSDRDHLKSIIQSTDTGVKDKFHRKLPIYVSWGFPHGKPGEDLPHFSRITGPGRPGALPFWSPSSAVVASSAAVSTASARAFSVAISKPRASGNSTHPWSRTEMEMAWDMLGWLWGWDLPFWKLWEGWFRWFFVGLCFVNDGMLWCFDCTILTTENRIYMWFLIASVTSVVVSNSANYRGGFTGDGYWCPS